MEHHCYTNCYTQNGGPYANYNTVPITWPYLYRSPRYWISRFMGWGTQLTMNLWLNYSYNSQQSHPRLNVHGNVVLHPIFNVVGGLKVVFMMLQIWTSFIVLFEFYLDFALCELDYKFTCVVHDLKNFNL